MQKEGKVEAQETAQKENPVTPEEVKPFMEDYRALSAKYGLEFAAHLDYQLFGIGIRFDIIRAKKAEEDKKGDDTRVAEGKN